MPKDLRDKTGPPAKRLGRLRETLWHQWGLMDAAWHNHNPADGNVDTETLIDLGKTVEATRVAVTHVLQISGTALEIGWEMTISNPTTTRCGARRAPTLAQGAQYTSGTGGKVKHTTDTAAPMQITKKTVAPGWVKTDTDKR